jgi:hypothetical protein
MPIAASPGVVNDVQGLPTGIVHSSPVMCGEPDVVLDVGSTVNGGKVAEPSFEFGRVAAQY